MTLGTIPLWLHVKDAPRRERAPAAERVPGFLEALRALKGQRVFLLFLAGSLVSADVANTLIQWATYYFEKGEGLTKDQAGTMVIALSVTALAGGLVVGRLADRLAPTRIYLASCLALVLGLLGVAFFPGNWVTRGLLVLTGGVGVATIWTIGRQLVIRLAPPDRLGACMGLYGVTVKVSILGTTLFPVLREVSGFRAAILAEAGMLLVGCVLIERLHRRIARRARA
jgi:UMF1 family MFS transporter